MKTFLLILSLALAGPARADAVDRLRAFAAGARTAEAEFTQTVADRSGRITQRASGHMAFARPGKFRWDYRAPYAQLIVGDGERLWLYDPELEQVTVRKLGDAIAATPAALLAGDDAIEKYFALKGDGASDGLDWLMATPRQRDASFARIRMGFRGNTLEVMELADHFGQTTTLKLSGFKRNPTLDAGAFRFVPPKGGDLIGD